MENLNHVSRMALVGSDCLPGEPQQWPADTTSQAVSSKLMSAEGESVGEAGERIACAKFLRD